MRLWGLLPQRLYTTQDSQNKITRTNLTVVSLVSLRLKLDIIDPELREHLPTRKHRQCHQVTMTHPRGHLGASADSAGGAGGSSTAPGDAQQFQGLQKQNRGGTCQLLPRGYQWTSPHY